MLASALPLFPETNNYYATCCFCRRLIFSPGGVTRCCGCGLLLGGVGCGSPPAWRRVGVSRSIRPVSKGIYSVWIKSQMDDAMILAGRGGGQCDNVVFYGYFRISGWIMLDLGCFWDVWCCKTPLIQYYATCCII